MRFGLICLMILGVVAVWADAAEPIFKRAGPTDVPTVSGNFDILKIADNYGDIAGVAACHNDLCVGDKKSGKLHRLRKGGALSQFSSRFDYLVGFDTLSDIAADAQHLYISDKSGIWRSEIGRAPIASQSPFPVFQLNPDTVAAKKPLAVDPESGTLYVGIRTPDNGVILAIDMETNHPTVVASGHWTPLALAVNSNGELWVAYEAQSRHFIASIESLTRTDHMLKALVLEENLIPQDIVFRESDLLISLGGPEPMIARAQFKYGNILQDIAPFVQGFSSPSLMIGKRQYWGTPTRMIVSDNGRVVFAEKYTGTLWMLTKVPSPLKNNAPTETIAAPKPNPDPEWHVARKPPEILRGSSIDQASSLKSGSVLENDDLLKPQDPPPEKEPTIDTQPE